MKCRPNNLNFKITNSSGPNGNNTSTQSIVSKSKKPRDKWMELQGIKNWEGLLDPLDDGLRDEILRYGEFVEAAYRCFDFDTSSPDYATCRYPKGSMLSQSGHPLGPVGSATWRYATTGRDREAGRRDVVIAYRGTATCMEWVENLRVALTTLSGDMAQSDRESMVQSGFLSLYTSAVGPRPSLQDSIRDEMQKILTKYGDEPLSITVTGHSLGAALATLTAHDINTTFKHAPLVTVVSFGGPRIGNKSFRSQLEKSGTKVLRIVNSDDPITKVPGFVLNESSTKMSEIRPLKWVQKCVEETQWVYAEIGKELRLSSKDCPHLSNIGE
ncbi:hypothetical protein DH2020_046901 [Rehmannia glutinosa]|uniref:Fungal lipase-type domain-containing protein n=1 Tax=Rehmannia glutinosa TaxID=99300 RepID=A0ABR0UAM7_REHGL